MAPTYRIRPEDVSFGYDGDIRPLVPPASAASAPPQDATAEAPQKPAPLNSSQTRYRVRPVLLHQLRLRQIAINIPETLRRAFVPRQPPGRTLTVDGLHVGTRLRDGTIVLAPGYDAERLQQRQLPDPQPDQDQPDPLAVATQLEATIALAEWQRQRHIPPAERIVGVDHADVGYEATLDIVAAVMRASR